MTQFERPEQQGLYNPKNEHDACGVGFVANIHGTKSHTIVAQGLQILTNLTHRGATGYDPKLGDGAGILIQMPDGLIRDEAKKLSVDLPHPGQYACGLIFFPQSNAHRTQCEKIITDIIKEEGQTFLAWRDVPTNNSNIADAAKALEPKIKQVIIGQGKDINDQNHFERKLFVIRKRIEHSVKN